MSGLCRHSWVAGFMRVHDEDLVSVATVRTVECERCELVIGPHTPMTVLYEYQYGER